MKKYIFLIFTFFIGINVVNAKYFKSKTVSEYLVNLGVIENGVKSYHSITAYLDDTGEYLYNLKLENARAGEYSLFEDYPLTEDKKNQIILIMHFGYDHNNANKFSQNWFLATQFMIWEVLYPNSNVYPCNTKMIRVTNLDTYMENIKKDIENFKKNELFFSNSITFYEDEEYYLNINSCTITKNDNLSYENDNDNIILKNNKSGIYNLTLSCDSLSNGKKFQIYNFSKYYLLYTSGNLIKKFDIKINILKKEEDISNNDFVEINNNYDTLNQNIDSDEKIETSIQDNNNYINKDEIEYNEIENKVINNFEEIVNPNTNENIIFIYLFILNVLLIITILLIFLQKTIKNTKK